MSRGGSFIIFLLLPLLFFCVPLAVIPAHAQQGATVTVVLTGSGSYNCGDPVAGVVRVTNSLQVPMQLYSSSDSVRVAAWLNDTLISDYASIGDGIVLQPGETQSFPFVLRLSNDSGNYPNVVNQAEVDGVVYHSTTYDPNASPIFSDFFQDKGITGITVNCTQSQSSNSTVSSESSSSSSSYVASNETLSYSASSSSASNESSASSASGGGTSQCLIATATYGSEMSPEVQFLKSFRNNQIMRTFAGSNFMLIFNAWYYSFSPGVANQIRGSDPVRGAAKILLYPLMGILHLSSDVFSILSFQPELAALVSGVVASSLIGLVYLALPLAGLFYLFRRRVNPTRTAAKRLLLGIAILLTGSFAVSEYLLLSAAMMIVTAGIILSALTAPSMLVALSIVRRINDPEPH